MTRVVKHYHFDVPVARVWQLGTDFARYGEWNVLLPTVRAIHGEPRAVGTKIDAVTRVLGREFDNTLTILEVDAPSYMKLRGVRSDGTQSTIVYRLAPGGGGSDLEMEFEYELPHGLLAQVADRLFIERAIERYLDHSVENFTALVEAREPVAV